MSRTEPPISGIVLAGGQARRLGGQDKGLIELIGRPLIARVLERIGPQVDELLISANRNAAHYAAYGHRVVADLEPGFQGPLSGLLAAGQLARHDWLLTLPCDAPFLPLDLAEQLMARAQSSGAPLIRAADVQHTHFTVMLMRRSLLPDLQAFVAGGAKRIQGWQARHAPETVTFPDPAAFLNINTPEELHAAALQQNAH